MIKNFRGFLSHGFFSLSSYDPRQVDGHFTYDSPVVPSSTDYKLDDLLAAGVKVAPVSTDVVHDDSSVHTVIERINNLNVDTNESEI